MSALGVYMAISYQEIESEALRLQPADRAHLLERLIQSFEPASEVQDAWVAEALRRRDEVQSGKVALVSGDEALARIRDRLL